MSPGAQSDSNGRATINEILHETAKYELQFFLVKKVFLVQYVLCTFCIS